MDASGSDQATNVPSNMAVMSTKAQSNSSAKKIPVGKKERKNTAAITNATMGQEILTLEEKRKLVALALINLSMDLNEANQSGVAWQAFPYPLKDLVGNDQNGLLIAIYHPDILLNVSTTNDKVVAFTVDNQPVGEVATSKIENVDATTEIITKEDEPKP